MWLKLPFYWRVWFWTLSGPQHLPLFKPKSRHRFSPGPHPGLRIKGGLAHPTYILDSGDTFQFFMCLEEQHPVQHTLRSLSLPSMLSRWGLLTPKTAFFCICTQVAPSAPEHLFYSPQVTLHASLLCCPILGSQKSNRYLILASLELLIPSGSTKHLVLLRSY